MTIYPTLAARHAAVQRVLDRRMDAWCRFEAALEARDGSEARAAYDAFGAAVSAYLAVLREEWRVPAEQEAPA